MAKMAQLMMEYNPQPPFDAGTPETAEKPLVESFEKLGIPLIEAFWTGVRSDAARTCGIAPLLGVTCRRRLHAAKAFACNNSIN